MGRFIVAPGVNPATTNVKVDIIDPMLPSAGAIMLLEPNHPATAWSSGVPSNGIPLPNLALTQAKTLFPSLTDDQLKATLNLGSSNAGKILAERTSKGGLHLARGTTPGDTNTLAALKVNSALVNAGGNGLGAAGAASHSYFMSLWGRVTKAYASDYPSGVPQHNSIGISSALGGFYLRRATGETNYPTDSRRIGYRAVGSTNVGTAIGPLLQNVGVNALAAMGTLNNAFILQNGNDMLSSSPAYGKTASFVFYRFYLEDLTASGRTYATVDALDNQMFTDAVLTAGGRYYNDTFTDPVTLG